MAIENEINSQMIAADSLVTGIKDIMDDDNNININTEDTTETTIPAAITIHSPSIDMMNDGNKDTIEASKTNSPTAAVTSSSSSSAEEEEEEETNIVDEPKVEDEEEVVKEAMTIDAACDREEESEGKRPSPEKENDPAATCESPCKKIKTMDADESPTTVLNADIAKVDIEVKIDEVTSVTV